MADFSRIAPTYDAIARLVFGNNLMQATNTGFTFILPGDTVLIMGGGTGKVLNALDKLNIPLQVWFLDSSETMLALARKQQTENIHVQFILADARDFIHEGSYDVILTPFFLDCFTTKDLVSLRNDWLSLLKPGGHWLFTDFIRTNSLMKDAFVKLMYLFFRFTAELKISETPDYDQFFDGLKLVQSKFFFGDMIESRVYTRS